MGQRLNLIRLKPTELLLIKPTELLLIKPDEILHRLKATEGVYADSVLDVDKAFEGIVFLLTGARRPDHQLLNGSVLEFEDERDGLIFRLLNKEVVKALHDEFLSLGAAELENRFDPLVMTALDIYPNDIWVYGREPYDYLMANYKALKLFLEKAVAEQMAVITVII